MTIQGGRNGGVGTLRKGLLRLTLLAEIWADCEAE